MRDVLMIKDLSDGKHISEWNYFNIYFLIEWKLKEKFD